MSRSERKRAWEAQERKNARTHMHICEWCPADDLYTCQKAPCQHLKKKPCPSHKWNAKKGVAPERLDFNPPPMKVYIGEYADFVPLSAKIAAEEMGKKSAEMLNSMIGVDVAVDIETNVPGQKHPIIKVDISAIEKKVVEQMQEAGQDGTGYAKYEDFL